MKCGSDFPRCHGKGTAEWMPLATSRSISLRQEKLTFSQPVPAVKYTISYAVSVP